MYAGESKYVAPLCYVVSVSPEGETYLKQILGEALIDKDSMDKVFILEALVHTEPKKVTNNLGTVYVWIVDRQTNEWFIDALTEEISKLASKKGKTTYFAIGENLEEAMYHNEYDCQEIIFTYFSFGERKFKRFWHKPMMVHEEIEPVVIHIGKEIL